MNQEKSVARADEQPNNSAALFDYQSKSVMRRIDLFSLATEPENIARARKFQICTKEYVFPDTNENSTMDFQTFLINARKATICDTKTEKIVDSTILRPLIKYCKDKSRCTRLHMNLLDSSSEFYSNRVFIKAASQRLTTYGMKNAMQEIKNQQHSQPKTTIIQRAPLVPTKFKIEFSDSNTSLNTPSEHTQMSEDSSEYEEEESITTPELVRPSSISNITPQSESSDSYYNEEEDNEEETVENESYEVKAQNILRRYRRSDIGGMNHIVFKNPTMLTTIPESPLVSSIDSDSSSISEGEIVIPSNQNIIRFVLSPEDAYDYYSDDYDYVIDDDVEELFIPAESSSETETEVETETETETEESEILLSEFKPNHKNFKAYAKNLVPSLDKFPTLENLASETNDHNDNVLSSRLSEICNNMTSSLVISCFDSTHFSESDIATHPFIHKISCESEPYLKIHYEVPSTLFGDAIFDGDPYFSSSMSEESFLSTINSKNASEIPISIHDTFPSTANPDTVLIHQQIFDLNFHFSPTLDYTYFFIQTMLPLPTIYDIHDDIALQPIEQRENMVFRFAKEFITPNLLPIQNKRIKRIVIYAGLLMRKRRIHRRMKMAFLYPSLQMKIGSKTYDFKKLEISQVSGHTFAIRKNQKTIALYRSENQIKDWLRIITELQKNSSPNLLDLYLFALSGENPSKSFHETIKSAILSPFLPFVLQMLAHPKLDQELCASIYELFVNSSKIDFLMRSIILAELALNPIDDIFTKPSMYTNSLKALFISVSNSWLYKMSCNINTIRNPQEVLSLIYISFSTIPPAALLIVRLILCLTNIFHPKQYVIPCFKFLLLALLDYFDNPEKVDSLLFQPLLDLLSQNLTKSPFSQLNQFTKKILDSTPVIKMKLSIEEEKKIIKKLYEFMVTNIRDTLEMIDSIKEINVNTHPLVLSYYMSLKYQNKELFNE